MPIEARLKRATAPFALAVPTALPLYAQQWETIETFGGAWDTGWGDVRVFPGGPGYEGTYTEDNGRFWLEYTGHVFEGYWAEEDADERCDTPYLGSFYRGRLELGNSDHLPGVQMLWGYCDRGRSDKVWSFYERLPDGLWSQCGGVGFRTETATIFVRKSARIPDGIRPRPTPAWLRPRPVTGLIGSNTRSTCWQRSVAASAARASMRPAPIAMSPWSTSRSPSTTAQRCRSRIARIAK